VAGIEDGPFSPCRAGDGSGNGLVALKFVGDEDYDVAGEAATSVKRRTKKAFTA